MHSWHYNHSIQYYIVLSSGLYIVKVCTLQQLYCTWILFHTLQPMPRSRGNGGSLMWLMRRRIQTHQSRKTNCRLSQSPPLLLQDVPLGQTQLWNWGRWVCSNPPHRLWSLGDNFQDWLCPRRGRHFWQSSTSYNLWPQVADCSTTGHPSQMHNFEVNGYCHSM